MESKDPDIYAALKLGTHNIMGRVKSLKDGKLIFYVESDDEIPLLSFQHMDVFTSRHIYFRNLPVVIISDDKIQNDKSLNRKIKVKFHNSEVAEIITRIISI